VSQALSCVPIYASGTSRQSRAPTIADCGANLMPRSFLHKEMRSRSAAHFLQKLNVSGKGGYWQRSITFTLHLTAGAATS
jgi:hypothetical protein